MYSCAHNNETWDIFCCIVCTLDVYFVFYIHPYPCQMLRRTRYTIDTINSAVAGTPESMRSLESWYMQCHVPYIRMTTAVYDGSVAVLTGYLHTYHTHRHAEPKNKQHVRPAVRLLPVVGYVAESGDAAVTDVQSSNGWLCSIYTISSSIQAQNKKQGHSPKRLQRSSKKQ